MSIRNHFLLLVLAVLLPAFLATAIGMRYIYISAQKANQKALQETVRALAQVLDNDIENRESVLRTLADSPALGQGHLESFYRHAQKIASERNVSIVLSDPAGKLLLHTSFPLGARQAFLADAVRDLHKNHGEEASIVSRLFTLPNRGKYGFAVQIPVVRNGRVLYYLSMKSDAMQIQTLLEKQKLPKSWMGGIIDREGVIIASTVEPEKYIGRHARKGLINAMSMHEQGFYDGVMSTGVPTLAFYSRSPKSRWVFIVNIPSSEAKMLAFHSTLFTGWVSFFLFVSSLIGTLVFARKIVKPLEALRFSAQHLRQGNPLVQTYSGVKEIDEINAVMAQASHDIGSMKKKLEDMVFVRTEQLRRANRLLAAVFDRAPTGILITDIKGNIVRTNPAFQRLTRLSEQELLTHSIESLTYPEDYPGNLLLLRQLMNGEIDSINLEKRYKVEDELIWVSVFSSVIRDEENASQYLVAIVQNIDDRKRAEKEILASQAELRLLYDRLQNVREEEKAALAREVHDQLGQILSAAKIDIKLLENDIQCKDSPLSLSKISRELRSASSTIEKAIQSVRKIAFELRPPELETQGLFAAIQWHARDFERRTRIKCSVTNNASPDAFAGAISSTLFRIFQEAMTNVLRHAKATRVSITIEQRGNMALLRICDDGMGITRSAARNSQPASMGIRGMRERATLVEGRLLIGPLRPRGTLLSVRIPLAESRCDSGTVVQSACRGKA